MTDDSGDEFPAELLTALLKNQAALESVEQRHTGEFAEAAVAEISKTEEAALRRRHEALATLEGFSWRLVVTDRSHDLAAHMNTMSDPTIMRSVADIRLERSTAPDGAPRRRLTVKVKSSIFAAEGEMWREVDRDGTSTGLQPMVWKKSGAAQKGSVFQLFDPAATADEVRALFSLWAARYMDPLVGVKGADAAAFFAAAETVSIRDVLAALTPAP